MNAAARSALPLLALLMAVPLLAAQKPQIDVQELTLANGMKFLLFERHESPTVAAGWTARVGSVNEHTGITGLSHFFEHMMFKGTHVIGTRDIAQDLDLIRQQEQIQEGIRAQMEIMRERLRRGEIDDLTKPENRTERYRELEKRFDELVARQRAIIVKDQMDQIYTSNGGEFMNAFTSEDQTGYFVRVPSNRLELWAWLESDRLLNPVFREFYTERDVVFEERRLRTEATPLGKYDEAFNALFWEAHPYHWPVVGWPSDIPTYSLAQAEEYFATYYAHNNLTGILVGDFKAEAVKPLLERYFGRIPRGKVDPPPIVTLEPKQLAEKRYRAEAETSPTVRIWWHGVPFVHKDAPVLDLLTDILSGRTGRLYKGLVMGRQVANECSASIDAKKYAGRVEVECVAKDGKDPEAVEAAVYEEIGKLQAEPVPAEELQKVKNEAKANAFRRLSSPIGIMFQLMQYEGTGDWRLINSYPDLLDAVTAGDIQRAARAYFTREVDTVGIFLRKQGAATADPEIAALPAPAQAMVRQSLEKISAETDPEKLREGIARMQEMAGQAPPEMRPAVELILKRAQQRLDALTSGNK